VLIEISTSFYISVYFLDAFWLCYQLIMHAYSDTDLRKFDLCKFFSFFLVFQCGASGRSLLAFGRVGSSRSDGSFLEFGPSWSHVVRTIRVFIRTSVGFIVRTTSLYRPDVRDLSTPSWGGERPDIITPPSRRGPHSGYKMPRSPVSFSPYPTKSTFWHFVSEWFWCFWSNFIIVFCAFSLHSRYFSSFFLFQFFF
jgi:hypothetical protein